MTQLDQAASMLLTPGGLDLDSLDTGLSHAMGAGIDYADLYFQRTWQEGWVLEDGEVKEASYNIDGGVGVRSLAGEKTGFAYSNQITADALVDTGKTASGIVRSGTRLAGQAVRPVSAALCYPDIDPLAGLSADDKVAMLKLADRVARAADTRVSQVSASLSGTYEVVLVRASDGTLAADIRPLVRFNVSVIAAHNGRRERGSAGGGGRYSMAKLRDAGVAERYAKEAVRQALVNLEAVDAPAGQMPVVLGAGWPGILL
ncbi:MAG: PmbA/TldA family metallopeptidase, partial [Halomonadaceae bacterium]